MRCHFYIFLPDTKKSAHSKLNQQYTLKMYFENVNIDVPLIY